MENDLATMNAATPIVARMPASAARNPRRVSFASPPTKTAESVQGLDQKKVEKDPTTVNPVGGDIQSSSSKEVRSTSSPTKHMALLLPITSKHSDLWMNLQEFLSTFSKTTNNKSSGQPDWKFSFFLGLPELDERGVSQESSSKVQKIRKVFEDSLTKGGVNNHQVNLHFLAGGSEPRVCAMWRDLAAIAYSKTGSDCEFFALLRDDLKFRSESWPNAVAQGFKDIHTASKQPFGFGCVAFLDESFPAFPTFPVLHRTHFDIFNAETPKGASLRTIFPDEFAQRDAEAFLFEIYFRYKCATILSTARVVRQPQLRTEQEAKRRTIQITNALPPALEKCESWLSLHGSKHAKPLLGFDIIVPSFRATKDVLERILRLPTPSDFACRFIIVCDNPDSKVALKVFQDLESDHEHNPSVRIRMNAKNVGPGATRNHGLAESTGDYVLFLDDDVLPECNIITEYCQLIGKYPNAAGFIGRTVLPPPQTPRQFAIAFAGIAYFWDISSKTNRDLPWGITANLCVKRSKDIWFRCDIFCKGGGGEDVDYCLLLDDHYRREWEKTGTSCPEHINLSSSSSSSLLSAPSLPPRSFVPAPKATVYHPYWNNGDCYMHHFFKWTKGDSALMEVYPKKSFLSLPDFSESFILLSLTLLLLTSLELVSVITMIIALAAFITSEVLYETICHLQLVPEWGLPFTVRVGAMTCVLRTYTDFGRFYGQLERGTLLQKLFQRYNWFEDNWPEYPRVERTRAIKRGLFRWTGVATALYLTSPLRHALAGSSS